jgi:hypothetical protein
MHPRTWKCFAFVTVLALMASAVPAIAADKADVNGTWAWSFTGQNGQTFEQKAKLKQEGDKVTGVITGRNNQETEIKDGKLSSDGELTFNVTRERQGQTVTMKYKGKVEGDTIKGTSERDGGQSREWVAKRAKDEK